MSSDGRSVVCLALKIRGRNERRIRDEDVSTNVSFYVSQHVSSHGAFNVASLAI